MRLVAAIVAVLSAAVASAPNRNPPPQVTRLALPFDGIWGVLQGMDSDETHHGYAAFALDFVPAQPKGTKAPRKGAPLTAFACYGRPVLAPADGTVVAAAGAARDWPAYTKGRDPGNYVIIQHAPAEYTELRHLAAGSVTLTVGQRVRRGDVVGRCGNSGNARMPHLHLGLLSSFEPIVTRPMAFSDYEVVGADAAWHPGDGTPRKGEILRRKPGAR
jgi:murein DD-endopeptidase MepM/ murein hydrolase activator NlpD